MINLYLNDAGRVEVKTELLRMFGDSYWSASSTFYVSDTLDVLSEVNFDVSEVWALHDGASPISTDETDFDVLPYSPELSLDLSNGQLIRIVAEPREREVLANSLFFDYDISNGGFYTSYDDLVSDVNKLPTSQFDAQVASHKHAYCNFREFGINDPVNYQNNGKPKLVFGAADMYTEHTSETYQGKFLNKLQDSAMFGIVTGLDEDGYLIYNPDIDHPYLFGNGSAVGKTLHTDYQLRFTQRGGLFTFSNVVGIEQDLEVFNHPSNPSDGVITKVWTNNFWPLDNASSINVDGHDMRIGAYDPYLWNPIRKDVYNTIPISNDGLGHNGHFGMNFKFEFQIPEHYCGPLEYTFFGDDDMWVFLDNTLICDLGGVHATMGEFVDLWDYIEPGDREVHTMTVYYLERGAFGSSCWIQFYLPNALPSADLKVSGSLTFTKKGDKNEPIANTLFGLYYQGNENNLINTFRSDENGQVLVTGLHANTMYYIRELEPADGYVAETVFYVAREDDSGNWFMHLADDPDRKPVTEVINNAIESPEMPETGGDRALWIVFFVVALVVANYLYNKAYKIK